MRVEPDEMLDLKDLLSHEGVFILFKRFVQIYQNEVNKLMLTPISDEREFLNKKHQLDGMKRYLSMVSSELLPDEKQDMLQLLLDTSGDVIHRQKQ